MSLEDPNPLGNLESVASIGNWADAVDQENIRLAAAAVQKRTETIKDGIKTIVDIIDDKDNGRCKVISTYKVIHKKVPRVVARRKQWKKFGASANDDPGPQISTTYVADPVEMQFLKMRLDDDDMSANNADPILKGSASKGHCRFCKSDEHWSINCPYKEMYAHLNDDESETNEKAGLKQPSGPGKYVNPMARVGASAISERRTDDYTVRVTNLPEDSDTLDKELRELFNSVGRIERFFLAKDKMTNKPKGFAFITYSNRQDAEKAIEKYNSHRMHHLVMKVEWTKPAQGN